MQHNPPSAVSQPQAPTENDPLVEFLAKQNIDPNVPYVQIRDPHTGKLIYVRNPKYNPENVESQEKDAEDKDEEEQSYCSIVSNFCPESQDCVWWCGPAAGEEKEGEDPGGCSQVASVIASERANVAKAEFYENALKIIEAALTADPGSSALGNFIGEAATYFQLKNENIIRESGVTVAKTPPKKVKKDEETKLDEESKPEELSQQASSNPEKEKSPENK